MKKVELLAPAGNLEKLKMAFVYGADAVYIGGEEFSLRAYADNFSLKEINEGVKFAHKKGKRVFLTLNIIPHNRDIEKIYKYVKELSSIDIDAIIFSDPSVYTIIKELMPEMELHLSTQFNNTNYLSAKFWYDHGIRRIVLARELSLEEVLEIKNNVPKDMELEIFVHGSMCISYSGRCLLSSYMADRDSNQGNCAHPCRWKYYLVEEKRPGIYMPVYENERGTFIFNSKDLCMVDHIPQMIDAGVSSFKIEGRIKSAYYVATVVKTYRDAIYKYYENPEDYKLDSSWVKEISKASHREYTTGFYLGKPDKNTQIYENSSYIRDYKFIGIVLEYDKEAMIAKIEQRNNMRVGDQIEVLRPEGKYFKQKIKSMKNEELLDIDVAPHPQMIVYMPMDEDVVEYTIIRKMDS